MAESEFTAASQLRHPGQFFRASARSLRASTALARRLFIRDVRSRYRQSVLGVGWIVLPVLAQTAIWLFLNAANIVNGGETRVPYPVYVLMGTLLWQSFSESLSAPNAQLSNASQMLSKIRFPIESILLAGLADVALNAAVRLAVAVPLLLWYQVLPGWGALLAPLGLLLLMALGFGLGLVLAPFSLLYHDLSRLTLLVTGFWLLVTPVAYTIPPSGPGRLLAYVNPVSPLLLVTREWLTGGAIAPGPSFVVSALLAVVLLVAGWVLLRLSVPHLIDRFGS